jgi:hypothetical protein
MAAKCQRCGGKGVIRAKSLQFTERLRRRLKPEQLIGAHPEPLARLQAVLSTHDRDRGHPRVHAARAHRRLDDRGSAIDRVVPEDEVGGCEW